MEQSFRWSRTVSFGGLACVVTVMVVASVLEKFYGTEWASTFFYRSPLFVMLWGVLSVAGMVWLFRCRMWRCPATFLLHSAFVLILSGALVTHLFGRQGRIHLRCGEEAVETFTDSDGRLRHFPFGVQLSSFDLEYYMGSFAPMDYVSVLAITDGGQTWHERVSMNHIGRYKQYRFYQSGYDTDSRGCTLAVAYDPYGIAVTYCGYLLLLVSVILFFFEPGNGFRRLCRSRLLRGAVTAVCFLGGTGMTAIANTSGSTEPAPRVLPADVAEAFGRLRVYYHDRICPVQTLARDFTVKLCGKPVYKGLTAEQVLSGWLFYYDDWKTERMIKIKGSEVRRLLDVPEGNAALTDFVGLGGYKLSAALRSGTVSGRRQADEANEKFNLASAVSAGYILKIYPCRTDSSVSPVWYAVADALPPDLPVDQWRFVRYSMDYIAEEVARGDFARVKELIGKIGKYQCREAQDVLPAEGRFKAEILYNTVNRPLPVAISAVVMGLLAFLFYSRRMLYGKCGATAVTPVLVGVLVLLLSVLVFLITLRGWVGGHLPLSNGYETMQFMAVCAVAAALLLYRRFELALSFGLLLGGLALLVAMMGAANPPVTPLMPVLSSPLLSIHVVTIMAAYVLLAFTMLNGVTALLFLLTGRHGGANLLRLYLVSRFLLYPAVFLLAVGIFIGAVWANVSWGRYWGWDPKEVWALVTMLVYSFAFHTRSLAWLSRPSIFHTYMVVAFLSVLITYFGVNFLLGGLHSYA